LGLESLVSSNPFDRPFLRNRSESLYAGGTGLVRCGGEKIRISGLAERGGIIGWSQKRHKIDAMQFTASYMHLQAQAPLPDFSEAPAELSASSAVQYLGGKGQRSLPIRPDKSPPAFVGFFHLLATNAAN